MSNFVPEKTALGIEFGSTRIKAVLIGPEHTPLAQGDYTWENQLHNGIWTYPLEQVWHGLQSAYAALAADVQQKYGCTLTKVGCIGISAMMHGYMAQESIEPGTRAVGKVRYSHRGAQCTLTPLENGMIKCVFDEPQRAMTPGQAAVFYQDEHILCGGTIEKM